MYAHSLLQSYPGTISTGETSFMTELFYLAMQEIVDKDIEGLSDTLLDLLLGTAVYHCCECSSVIKMEKVSIKDHVKAVARIYARIDRRGEDDFSPEVKGMSIHYYRSMCHCCKEWAEDNPSIWNVSPECL